MSESPSGPPSASHCSCSSRGTRWSPPCSPAVASAASYAVLNLVIYGYLRRTYGFLPFSRWARRTFVAVPAVLVPVALGVSAVVDPTLVTLPVFLALAGTLSLVVFALTGLQSEDEVVIAILERRVGTELTVLRRRLPLPNE